MKRKPRRSRGLAPVMLAGAILLSTAAAVAYFVPIPGVTYAAPVTSTSNKPTSTTQPEADPELERATALAKLEADLQAREATVKEKETQVADLMKDLTAQKGEADAVRKAAALYQAMPPYTAAPLMQALDPAVAVQILRLLDEDQAAGILAYMDPAKGAKLMSELMKPPASKADKE